MRNPKGFEEKSGRPEDTAMKKAVVGSLITALLAAGVAVAATTNVVSVNVVGFQKLDISGGASATYTLISVPMTKIPVVRGTITGNGANTISDSTMNWTPGEFATNVSGKETFGKSTFFVEITSSNAPLAGRHFYIANNDATTLTLVDNLGISDNALNTYSYKIVAANRVRDIFGETNAPVLFGSGLLTTADNILLWTPGIGWSTPIFFKNSGTPSTQRNHWIQSGLITDDMVIDRDEGIMVKRVAGLTQTNLTIAGEVSANVQAIVLEGSAYSMIGGMSVVDQTIGQSGLTNVLAGGSLLTTSDNLLTWAPGIGWSAPVFYKNSGTPSTQRFHWIQSGAIVDDSLILKSGQGYLILKRSAPGEWDRESPLK